MAKKIYKEIKRGFTLIELMVVISIISLLSSVVLTSLREAKEKAKNAALLTELLEVRTAMYLYRELPVANGEVIKVPEGFEASDLEYNSATESSSLDDYLKPLVDNDLIPEIPHHPDWPGNREEEYIVYSQREHDLGWVGGTGIWGCGKEVTDPSEITSAGILFVYSYDPDWSLPGIEPGVSICYEGSEEGVFDDCASVGVWGEGFQEGLVEGDTYGPYNSFCIPI